jgi:hypothetical protein
MGVPLLLVLAEDSKRARLYKVVKTVSQGVSPSVPTSKQRKPGTAGGALERLSETLAPCYGSPRQQLGDANAPVEGDEA